MKQSETKSNFYYWALWGGRAKNPFIACLSLYLQKLEYIIITRIRSPQSWVWEGFFVNSADWFLVKDFRSITIIITDQQLIYSYSDSD